MRQQELNFLVQLVVKENKMNVVTSLVNQEMLKTLEERIVMFVLDEQHIYLFFALIGIMALLRYIPFFQKYLFSENMKWVAAPINVGLSVVGVFLLNMTPAVTTGVKIFVVIAESALATFLYEAAIKRLLGFAQAYLGKRRSIDSAPPNSGGAQ